METIPAIPVENDRHMKPSWHREGSRKLGIRRHDLPAMVTSQRLPRHDDSGCIYGYAEPRNEAKGGNHPLTIHNNRSQIKDESDDMRRVGATGAKLNTGTYSSPHQCFDDQSSIDERNIQQLNGTIASRNGDEERREGQPIESHAGGCGDDTRDDDQDDSYVVQLEGAASGFNVGGTYEDRSSLESLMQPENAGVSYNYGGANIRPALWEGREEQQWQSISGSSSMEGRVGRELRFGSSKNQALTERNERQTMNGNTEGTNKTKSLDLKRNSSISNGNTTMSSALRDAKTLPTYGADFAIEVQRFRQKWQLDDNGKGKCKPSQGDVDEDKSIGNNDRKKNWQSAQQPSQIEQRDDASLTQAAAPSMPHGGTDDMKTINNRWDDGNGRVETSLKATDSDTTADSLHKTGHSSNHSEGGAIRSEEDFGVVDCAASLSSEHSNSRKSQHKLRLDVASNDDTQRPHQRVMEEVSHNSKRSEDSKILRLEFKGPIQQHRSYHRSLANSSSSAASIGDESTTSTGVHSLQSKVKCVPSGHDDTGEQNNANRLMQSSKRVETLENALKAKTNALLSLQAEMSKAKFEMDDKLMAATVDRGKMEQERSMLDNKIEQREKELESARRERDEAQSTCLALRTDISLLKDQLKTAESGAADEDGLRKMIAESESFIAILQQDKDLVRERSQAVIENLKREVAAKVKEKERMETELKTRLEELTQERDALERDVKAMEEESEETTEMLQTRVSDYESTIKSLREEIVQLNCTLCDRGRSDARQKQEVKQLKDELHKAARKLQNAEAEVKVHADALECEREKAARAAQNQKDKRLETIASLERALSRKEKLILSLQGELTELGATLDEKLNTDEQKIIASLRHQLSDKEQSCTSLEERIKSAGDEKKAIEQQMQCILSESSKTMEIFELAMQEKEQTIQKLQEEMNVMSAKAEGKIMMEEEELKALQTYVNGARSVAEQNQSLQEAVERHQQQKEELERTISDLQTKLDNAHETVSSLEKELQRYMDDARFASDQSKSLQEMVQHHKDRTVEVERMVADLQMKLGKANETSSFLEEQVQRYMNDARCAAEQNESLQEMVQNHKGKTYDLEAKVSDLQRKLDEASEKTSQLTLLEEQVNELEEAKAVSREESKRMAETVSILQNEIDESTHSLNETISCLKNDKAQLETEAVELVDTISALRSELDSMKVKTSILQPLQETAKHLELENRRVNEENADLIGKLSTLRSEVDTMKARESQIGSLEESIKQLEVQKTQVTKENAALEESLSALKQELGISKRQASLASSFEDHIERLEDEKKQMKKKHSDLAGMVANLRSELGAAREKASITKALEERILKVELDKSAVKQECSEWQKTVNALRNELDIAQGRARLTSSMEDRILQLELDKAKLTKTVADDHERETVVSSLQARIAELEKENGQVQKDKTDLLNKQMQMKTNESFVASLKENVLELEQERDQIKKEHEKLLDEVTKMKKSAIHSSPLKERIGQLEQEKRQMWVESRDLRDELLDLQTKSKENEKKAALAKTLEEKASILEEELDQLTNDRQVQIKKLKTELESEVSKREQTEQELRDKAGLLEKAEAIMMETNIESLDKVIRVPRASLLSGLAEVKKQAGLVSWSKERIMELEQENKRVVKKSENLYDELLYLQNELEKVSAGTLPCQNEGGNMLDQEETIKMLETDLANELRRRKEAEEKLQEKVKSLAELEQEKEDALKMSEDLHDELLHIQDEVDKTMARARAGELGETASLLEIKQLETDLANELRLRQEAEQKLHEKANLLAKLERENNDAENASKPLNDKLMSLQNELNKTRTKASRNQDENASLNEKIKKLETELSNELRQRKEAEDQLQEKTKLLAKAEAVMTKTNAATLDAVMDALRRKNAGASSRSLVTAQQRG